jgi:hypothetical protein
MTRTIVALVVALASSCAMFGRRATPERVDAWFGLYRHATGPCAQGFCPAECLRLRPAPGGGVLVELMSLRARGATCELNERGEGSTLPLVFDDVTLDAGRGVRLEVVDGALTVVVRKLASDEASPFCRGRASLEGVRFTAAERLPDGPCTTGP